MISGVLADGQFEPKAIQRFISAGSTPCEGVGKARRFVFGYRDGWLVAWIVSASGRDG